ncbi:MAG: GNAT family N-acetyltransferase [Myxococcota bacterium]
MHLELATTDPARLACFDVLRELRPHLVRERFLDELARLGRQGVQLAAVLDPDVRAVACFRFIETFATGPQLYIDDLVTAAQHRGRGYGAKLLEHLEGLARDAGCRFLELDSGSNRLDAHRFYRRHGLEPVALHFSKPTDGGGPWKEP